MMKKISALVLALVLCLSVVVLPVSAAFPSDYELPEGAKIAFKVELDKEYYKKGDTATVSVYFEADDAMELAGGAFIIGVNSAVFSQADNDKTAIKASAVGSDAFNSFFKVPNTINWAWQSSTVAGNIEADAAATDAENAAYDQYLKFMMTKNAQSGHEYAADTTHGITAAELKGEPIVQFQLKVSADVERGTKIDIGVPSGSYTKGYTYIKYITNPGTAGNTDIKSASLVDTTVAATSAMGYEVVQPLKGQMRYDSTDDMYDVRALANIPADDFKAVFTDATKAKEMIKEIGFVFAAGSNVSAPSMDAVKGLVEKGTAAAGYEKKTVNYISTKEANNYVFSCIVQNIPDAEAQANSLVAVGYVAWDSNADGAVDSYAYYPSAQTIAFKPLYDANPNK